MEKPKVERSYIPPSRAASQKGGKTAKERYGQEHFRRIGRLGGAATRDRHGREHYVNAGHKGGSTTWQRYGTDHFQDIGHRGGDRVKGLIKAALEAEKNQGHQPETQPAEINDTGS